jgi:hypothetical protein
MAVSAKASLDRPQRVGGELSRGWLAVLMNTPSLLMMAVVLAYRSIAV